jgi:hypothetical protein
MESQNQYFFRKILEADLKQSGPNPEDSPELCRAKDQSFGTANFFLERIYEKLLVDYLYQMINGIILWVMGFNPQLHHIINKTFTMGFYEGYTRKESEDLTQLILEGPQRIVHRN